MQSTRHLTPEQIQRYHDNGYLSPLEFLDPAEANKYRKIFASFEADPGCRDLPNRLNTYLRSGTHLVIPEVTEIAAKPEILDQVESLLGPNIMLYSAELFIKEAHTPGFVSWHQDLTYWGFGETDEELTAWVALSEASIKAGCMRFIPGSHQNHLLDHRDSFADDNLLSRGQSVDVDIDEDSAVFAPLEPGQFSIHHGHLFHASSANQSDDRRIGLALRYVTPGVRQMVASRDYAILLRGVDDQHNWVHIAPPSRAFEPASLTLYDKVKSDQQVALAQNTSRTLNIYDTEQEPPC